MNKLSEVYDGLDSFLVQVSLNSIHYSIFNNLNSKDSSINEATAYRFSKFDQETVVDSSLLLLAVMRPIWEKHQSFKTLILNSLKNTFPALMNSESDLVSDKFCLFLGVLFKNKLITSDTITQELLNEFLGFLFIQLFKNKINPGLSNQVYSHYHNT